MTIKIRASVIRLAEDMERALRKHDKGRGLHGWRKDRSIDLLYRIREETQELFEAIHNGHERQIRKEAADCANFAMMIHDKAIPNARKKAARKGGR